MHDFPVGANCTAPKPLAALAVIDPVWRVVRSVSDTLSPPWVSRRLTVSRSPEFMNRSCDGSGVKVASVEFTGFGGACGTPLLVTNAKLTYSKPTIFWHAGLSTWPVFSFCERLSMLSAAHHCVATQLEVLVW